jgi:tetratricopeptide (TPR) repeat protein
MDSKGIKAIWADGMEALEAGNHVKAEPLFSRAVNLIDELEDAEVREQMYRSAVFVLNRSPFSVLALKVAQEVIAFDRTSTELGRRIGSLLAYGTALAHQDQLAQAAKIFQDVLDLALASKRFADAASASTNLGAMLARQDDTAGALKLFRGSLEYLKSEAFPDTEKMTRLNILAVYEETRADPRTCLEFARETMDRLANSLDDGTRERVMIHVRNAAARFRKGGAGQAKWLTDRFPELAGGAK